jgi:phage/plasmid-like protein (TIGR03299 family)
LDIWQKAAGMDWRIEESAVLFRADPQKPFDVHTHAESKVLYRSDTHMPLSVVSARYQTVQPAAILEFYRDLVSVGGFELETAGVLKDGKKLWALAKTGQEALLKGGDRVKGYLLLATSCDGTLATTAQFTSVRVVCQNTLQMALGDRDGVVRVPHSTQFDPEAVKRSLGVAGTQWATFQDTIQALAERKVNRWDVMRYVTTVLGDPERPLPEQPHERAMKKVVDLFTREGRGADLASADKTAWGLVNAVTEYVDHHRRARSQDSRLDSAWFGPGATLKARALTEAVKLVA